VWPGSVVFLGAEMECSAVVSLDLRVQLSGVWLEGVSHMVEELRRAVQACSGLRFRRGTSLVTTAQLSSACFVLLSRVVGGGVSCVFVLVRGFVCVVVFASACYVPIATP
jgi:hypothetical protein